MPDVVKAEMLEVLRRAVAVDGEITRVYCQPEGDIGVYLAGRPDRVGFWIHAGYVDHVAELDGSVACEVVGKTGLWRTELSTARRHGEGGRPSPAKPRPVCPVCQIELPLTGQCGYCG